MTVVPEPLRQKAELPQIPGYRIEGIVGKGATGIVYRARQLSVERVVALKVLHKELVGATPAAHRLQREARTTARLAHPNIISAIDMGEIGGMWWYAMELVDGVSLAERLRDGALSEREALRLFIPLCDALEHAFERGVVHRDIKPANILIERGGRALLVDLGLAFADDDPLLTKGGGTLGTPHYISPEQARDPSSADVQSDLWSLGATLYHAVCGRPPFRGDSVAEILSSVLYARIPDPAQQAPHLSKGFVLVLRKCLTRDKQNRYLTPAELQSDLERIRERRAPRVQRASLEPVERDTRALRRNLALGAIALFAAGAAGWALRHENVAPRADGARASEVDPIGALAEIADKDPAHLSNALARVLKMQGLATLSPSDLARLEDVRNRIYTRLEAELWSFKRDAGARVAKLLDARDFDAAQALATHGLRQETKARIGTEELPGRLGKELEAWIASEVESVRAARERAEDAYAVAFDRAYDEEFLPRVDRLQSQGSWREARELLTVERFLAAARLDARGISPAVVEGAVEGLRKRLDVRRESLDEAWNKLDLELERLVHARVAELRLDLENRAPQDYDAELRASWARALAERSLSVDEMPPGLLHRAHEELEKGRQALAAIDRRLAEQDAQSSLALLEEETVELWRARRYADVARRFESALADPWRRAVHARLALRAREARLLEGLLARAAQGVRERDGKQVELRLGTIVLKGVLDAGRDPARQSFRMTLVGGRVQPLALRAPEEPEAPEPSIVGTDAIETLAGLAPEGPIAGNPDDQLLRALLRSREGAPDDHAAAQAALAALNAGPLPRDEPLVQDLEERTRSALLEVKDVAGERRAHAEKSFLLLRREIASPGSRESKQRRIEELLQSYADVLAADRLAELRRWRDEQYADAKPWTREEFERVFGADRTELAAQDGGRVRLSFALRGPKAGAFEQGAWIADGSGWSPARSARSDADLFETAAPTLALRDPFRAQGEITLRLRIEQPQDSTADLLLVSVAGFHVAFSGAQAGRPARCLVDTRTAPDVVARARAGEGTRFDGLRPGTVFELRIVVHRLRGTARVEIDGDGVFEGQLASPRDDPQGAVVAIRSWEPVRLLEATLEGTRR